MIPSIETIQKWFAYDPIEGVLIRRKKLSSRLSDIVSCLDKRVYIFGVRYPYTHIIWVVHFGKWPDKYIDHKDHNQHNNKLYNLREANANQNQHNKLSWGIHGKGVYYDSSVKRNKPYVSRISVDGTSIYLGTFATGEEAAEAYKEAALKYHGEFACPV